MLNGTGVGVNSEAPVAIANNGNVVTSGEDFGYGVDVGRVHVFHLVGDQWQQLGNTMLGESVNDHFGQSLALSSDGSTVAVGGIYFANVFQLKDNTWQQLGQSIEYDLNGDSVAISSNGKILAGSWGSGSARVFRLSDENMWEQMGSNLDVATVDALYSTVELSNDGLTVAVGVPEPIAAARDVAGKDSGQVRVFRFVDNDWEQIGQALEGEMENDKFGRSVALSADGTIVAGGANGYVRIFSLLEPNP
jgi:hypothetical protein